jgi:hypothetical protein
MWTVVWTAVWRFVRRTWIFGGKVLFWTFTVFIFGAIPIGIHLLASHLNGQAKNPHTLLVADGYLYAFIVAMTAMTDALVDRKVDRRNTTTTCAVLAVVAALGNLTAQLDIAARDVWSTNAINLLFWPLFAALIVTYGIYKVPTLYGAAKTDWQAAGI